MPSKLETLVAKLREILQIDQPDLDFGIYRIIRARADEINNYLENTLPGQVKTELEDAGKYGAEAEIEQLHEKIKEDYGKKAFDKEGRLVDERALEDAAGEKYTELFDAASGTYKTGVDFEDEVYTHLLTFFSRYYEKGDFISKRRYKGDTYAIPYSGEEVVLHWANKDQYYVKSSEHSTNFTFALDDGRKVQFRLAAADTARDNNKSDEDRIFVMAKAGERTVTGDDGEVTTETINPVEVVNGNLVVRFDYRPVSVDDWDDERLKRKKASSTADKNPDPAQEDMTLQAMAELEKLMEGDAELEAWRKPLFAAARNINEFRSGLSGNRKKYFDERDLRNHCSFLGKQLRNYTARQTSDYFVHKDLGGFLRRELDFYIKNEVMNLDDVQAALAFNAIEKNLRMIQCLRKIALKLIDFMAQIEEFQKKLWLKKKFVVETNYCITLDRVPEELYGEIAANQAQIDEWIKLGFVKNQELEPQINTDGHGSEKNEPDLFNQKPLVRSGSPAVQQMKANPYLVLDTKFFDEAFKERLLATIENFDEQCGGILVHSENFQALNLLRNRYRDQVKCIYIDPPYNTGKDDFPYKDGYKSSSWLSGIHDRVSQSLAILASDGVFLSSISDFEVDKFRICLSNLFSRDNFLATFIWNNEGNIDNQSKVKVNHEYILAYCRNEKKYPHAQVIAPDIGPDSKLYNDTIENSITKNGPANPPSEIALPVGFPAAFEEGCIPPGRDEWPHLYDEAVVKNSKLVKQVRVYSGWSSRRLLDSFLANDCQPIHDSKGLKTWFKITHTGAIYCYKERNNQSHVLSIIRNAGTVKKMSGKLSQMGFSFSYPKPIGLIEYFCNFTNDRNALVLDFYAGSGTTSHAVINVNRKQAGNSRRRYLLIEMGDHFNKIIKPRIQKVIYSENWKNGKPTTRNTGVSHCFKYMRLESYEDALNNLTLQRDRKQDDLFAKLPDGVREDYLLRYMLDIESKGSLLSIDQFKKPFDYQMEVTTDSTGARQLQKVDLVETFNYLIGLRVRHIDSQKERGFVRVEGELPDGSKACILWRDCEEIGYDELNKLCERLQISADPNEREYDVVYVNGDHSIPHRTMRAEKEGGITRVLKLRSIEEEFLTRMWDTEGVS